MTDDAATDVAGAPPPGKASSPEAELTDPASENVLFGASKGDGPDLGNGGGGLRRRPLGQGLGRGPHLRYGTVGTYYGSLGQGLDRKTAGRSRWVTP